MKTLEVENMQNHYMNKLKISSNKLKVSSSSAQSIQILLLALKKEDMNSFFEIIYFLVAHLCLYLILFLVPHAFF